MRRKFAVHQIDDINRLSFSAKDYSKLKAGSLNIARQYGFELAEDFYDRFLNKTIIKNDFVVYSSAYTFIPNAASLITKFFVYRFNELICDTNYSAFRGKIFRAERRNLVDYGKLTKQERENRLLGESLHIDKEFAKNKTLIIIDDIRITGTHEQNIELTLNKQRISSDVYFLYYAEVINDEIPATFESYLNYACVYDLNTLLNLKSTDDVKYIVRTIRYILEASKDKFLSFIEHLPYNEKEEIYYYAVCQQYNKNSQYIQNIKILKNLIESNAILSIQTY